MERSERPIVIGGGAAGLAACMTLEAAGHAPLLLEAQEKLGGRLRTDYLPDGTPVDVGFQVLLTAYPELKRWTDIPALNPVAFVPGAKVFLGNRWRTLADPRRWPGSIPATLSSGIGNWGDRMRILRLVREACSGTDASIQNGLNTGNTLEFLRSRNLSEGFIQGFLRPFFSGIFLDDSLSPPPAQFLYTLRMFAMGDAVRPERGMQALVDQWVGRLENTEIRCKAVVTDVLANEVKLEGGEILPGAGVIDTVSPSSGLDWNACYNAVFTCGAPVFGKPIIGLLPGARCVTNLHFMEDVQGEEGKGRLNVTAVFTASANGGESMEECVRSDLQAVGMEVGELQWSTHIAQALPKLTQVQSARVNPKREGVYIAGDHTAAPSLDAALRSGRMAAEHWLKDQG